MTHFLALRDVRRVRAFYADLLGGRVAIAQDPCIVRLANSWVIMNPRRGPTPDERDVQLVSSEASSRVSSFVNLRVADIEASYRVEVGQATGLVGGRLAVQAPAGREAGRGDGR
jgi:hypothetical protein